jgi:hypothetical protein
LIRERGLIGWSVKVLPGDGSVMETSPNEEGTIHGFQDQGIHETRIGPFVEDDHSGLEE